MQWTQAQREELISRWTGGQKRTAISRAMGLTMGQVAGAAMRLNLHNTGGSQPHDVRRGSFEDTSARTRWRHTVREPAQNSNLLKTGRDQRKLGSVVTKGPWRGYPIFSLTLEERATCPRSCAQWLSCYANNMNWARRWQHGDALEKSLWSEISVLQARFPRGFVVRLHLVGDFWSPGYVMLWEEALQAFPALRVFGYSAWPHRTKIGRAVKDLRDRHWDRFAVRTSGADLGPRTIVIEDEAAKPEGAIICPAQTNKTATCGSCGLCWSPAAKEKVVAFLRH